MSKAALALMLPPLLALYAFGVMVVLDTSLTYTQYLLVVPLAYFLGSIPWGYMITKVRHNVDIREYGSGRVGTSNVLRFGGKRLAAIVLVLDLSKGTLAVLLARAVADTPIAEVIAGILVMIAHNWSPFMGFKGGRGIAPGAGVMVVISPISTGIGISIFALLTFFTKYISLGSLIGVFCLVVVLLVQVNVTNLPSTYLIFGGVGGLIIFWQHKDNIQRLLKGAEHRLGQPAKKLAE